MNNEWLTTEARQERIELLTKSLRKLKKLIDKGEETNYHYKMIQTDMKELKRLKRIHRAEHDMLYYMYEYFSDDCNPENDDNLIPAGQTYENAAEFHEELCELLDDTHDEKTAKKTAWVVGREHAKTAYVSNGYLSHEVVYRLRKYIVLVSETADVAADFIKWTADQLKNNAKLRADFGPLMDPVQTKNEVDNQSEFVTASGTKVEAKGVSTQMRGLRHGSHRPDLFILDDLESIKNTGTPELRKKNLKWFRSEMLPALPKTGMLIYIGTIVHFDSLLNHVITKRKDFRSRKFPAILSFAERSDLWEEWRKIYRQDKETAADEARAFYLEHEKEMLKGTKVLWPERHSYYDLMEKWENDGSQVFHQEYLCNPLDEEAQIFKIESFSYYETGKEFPFSEYEIGMGIDFAMGKKKGDFSAIVTIARNKKTKKDYVVDAFLDRVHPDVFLQKIAEKVLEFQPDAIGAESQMAQEYLVDKLKERLQESGYPAHKRVEGIQNRQRKELRIESMQPDTETGKIIFNPMHKELLEQFERFGSGYHDDGPDALDMARRSLGKGKKQLQEKPSWA